MIVELLDPVFQELNRVLFAQEARAQPETARFLGH
jgi:hypothetical protein